MRTRVLALLATALIGLPSAAQDFRLGALTIDHAWSRPTLPGMTVGVAYLSITNHGKAADALIGASSPVADSVQIHQTMTVNNMTGMRPLTELAIAPGATVKAEPGGIHFMLMGVKAPIEVGKPVPLTLEFRVAGKVTLQLDVRTPAQP